MHHLPSPILSPTAIERIQYLLIGACLGFMFTDGLANRVGLGDLVLYIRFLLFFI